MGSKIKLIKNIEPKLFRFFKTIYNPEDIFVQNGKNDKDCVKEYLEQDNNGEWIVLNYEELKYTAEKEIDFDFIKTQMKYASSLSKRDILTASSYSFNGDTIINSYKRNEFDFNSFKELFKPKEKNFWDSNLFPFFPQFIDIMSVHFNIIDKNEYTYKNYKNMLLYGKSLSQETWYKIFDLFISDFRRIINNSPKVVNEINTWRGVNSEYLYNYAKIKKKVYKNTQFLSTSFDLSTSHYFIGGHYFTNERKGYELQCCLLNITIPVGSNVLLLMPYSKYLQEYEVLLNDQVVFKFIKNNYIGDNYYGFIAVTNIQIVNNKVNENLEEIDIEDLNKEAGFTMIFGNKNSELEYLEKLI
jgi:hypothetical protein